MDPSLAKKKVKVCRALYGLAISPRAFNKHLHSKILSYGYTASPADPSLYIRNDADGQSFILAYVDDLLFVGNDKHRKQFQQQVNIDTNPENGFKVRDYGTPTSFLGMEFARDILGKIFTITQTAYIKSMGDRFNITADNAPTTPLPPNIKIDELPSGQEQPDPTEFRAMVGSLMFAANCSRPDIAHAVHQLSRHLHCPNNAHVKLARGVIAYLMATDTIGLRYDGNSPKSLLGFTDADWGGDRTTARSTSGYVFMMNNAAITWSSSLQRTVAHSTGNAEYVALAEAGREAMWLRSLEKSVKGVDTMAPTVLFEDNKAALKWASDPANHKKTRHINIAYHSIREQVADFKNLTVKYVATALNNADAFTKSLPLPQFRSLFRRITGMGNV
jgi:hypothetical protein